MSILFRNSAEQGITVAKICLNTLKNVNCISTTSVLPQEYGDRGNYGRKFASGESSFYQQRNNNYGERRNRYDGYGRSSTGNRRSDFQNQNRDRWSNVSGFEGRSQRSFRPRFGFGAGENLQQLNFSDFDLKAVNKENYQEHEAVKARSQKEIDEWLAKNEISLNGKDIPKPIFSLQEAQFPGPIEELLSKQYEKPTEIQSITWPTALSGRDLISIAKTGSGKTLGFILPGIVHAISQPKRLSNEAPLVLVLLPTRELARQVEEVTIPFARQMHLRTACLYGGASKTVQAQSFERGGVDICIATPGRLLDFLQDQVMDLKRTSYLVFDEADRMLDMGFEPQIRKIVSQIRPDRQSLMFSATWPREIRNLASDFLQEPVHLQCGDSELTINRNITQRVEVLEEMEKPTRLVQILDEAKKESEYKTLIFVATKMRADVLARKLSLRRFKADAIHGDKSQTARDSLIERFRSNPDAILVATDVAARGLDINDVKYVINYDHPNNITDYVHRIGRTGRCEKKGTSISFITPDQPQMAQELIKLMQEAGQEVPESLENLLENRYQQRQRR